MAEWTCWRQGGKVPHHVYHQRGPEPDRRPWPDGDPPIATFLDPRDAELAVYAVNAMFRVARVVQEEGNLEDAQEAG